MGVFIKQEQLPALKKYKYSAEDHSFISNNILRPFWKQFVKIFPLWMAPNMVTLLGFFFVIVNFITMLIVDPTHDREPPRWVYLTYAVGLFLYQTFDACDGSHARRTGQSGPLGELFDHCVDAMNTSLILTVVVSTTHMGYNMKLLIVQIAALGNFYLSTWETYHTGTLYLSGFSGPVEGILILVGLFILTFFTGPNVYALTVYEALPENITSLLPASVLDITITQIYIGFGVLGMVFNIYGACGNVIKYYNKKGKSAVPAILGIAPFAIFYAGVFAWAHVAPLLLSKYAIVYLFAIGAAFAMQVGQMILAHLVLAPFPHWNVLLFFPFVGLAVHYIAPIFGWDADVVTVNTLFACFGATLSIYAFFVLEIIDEITNYLDIWCLRIKYPQKKTE
ncbi:Cholinephosphotransferase 1 [Yarrowia sp. C11]|nr:Cholinephosphotransferase 1 [Yarrowia sp. E02]KAG5373137.1 Cholinephosphotransferase 1 [Yarrowia sp. C11]